MFFTELVGFSDDMSMHTQILQPSLLQSVSGTYYQDAHPLVTDTRGNRDLKHAFQK